MSTFEDAQAIGFQQLAVSSSVVTLTPTTAANAAVINCETDAIRYTLDGTTPSASVGMLLYPTSNLELKNAQQLSAFKAIRVTSDAQLNITYYRKNYA